MPKDVKLVLTIRPAGTEETLQATFQDEEWKLLLEFLSCSQGLERTHLVRNGSPGLSFGFKREAEGMTGFSQNLPHDDHVAALLHRLRPFLLQKERTNFGKICNMLARRFDSESMRLGLSAVRKLFSADGSQRLFTMTANEQIINSENADEMAQCL